MADKLMTSILSSAERLTGTLHLRIQAVLPIVVVLLVLWVFWVVYTFYVLPLRYPNEPRQVPYWIPIIGNAVPFFMNSHGFLNRARKTMGFSNDPFAFTAFGTKFYVITQARHAAEVDKNTDTLSFDEFVQDFVRATGVSEPAIETLYRQTPFENQGFFPNPTRDPLGKMIRHMHVHQLHPGQNQELLEAKFLQSFHETLRLESIDRGITSPEVAKVSLYRWCADFFTRAGEHAYFGPALRRIDPEFSNIFYVFDEFSWQITYQLPDILAQTKTAAQKRLQHSLKRYFQIPQDQRSDVTWFTTAAENELRALGIGDDDIATLFLTIYLTINTNTRRTTFWMLTHLIHNPSLIEAVRGETEAAFKGDTLVNPGHLFNHDLCPIFESIWLETLRVSSTGSSVRCVNEDTLVGEKLLRKGNKIIIPFRLLHYDESVFTEDTTLFRPERFLQKGNRTRGGNWRPFGGGRTICTGRYVAEHVIKMCVAIILRRLDIELVGNDPIPRGDEGTPGLGIMGIRKGEDFSVKITPRAY